jgi:4-amino-4-deoxy-L-arabinose transferase-like glycosyltransferase
MPGEDPSISADILSNLNPCGLPQDVPFHGLFMIQNEKFGLSILFLISFLLSTYLFFQTYVISIDGAFQYIPVAKLFVSGAYKDAIHHGRIQPLYAFLVALVSRWVADFELAGKSVSSFFGILIILPVYFLGKQIFDKKIAFVSALLFTIHPYIRRFSADVLKESAYLFFLALGIWFAWKTIESGKKYPYLFIPLFSAIAYLVRPDGLEILLVVFFYILFIKMFPVSRNKWTVISFLLLASAILCLPFFAYLGEFTRTWVVSEPATGVSLKMDKSSPQGKGAVITFTAAHKGGTEGYEYYFTFRNPKTGLWSVGQAYGDNPVWQWNTTGIDTGMYSIQVWARSVGSKADYEAWTGISYEITPLSGSNVSLIIHKVILSLKKLNFEIFARFHPLYLFLLGVGIFSQFYSFLKDGGKFLLSFFVLHYMGLFLLILNTTQWSREEIIQPTHFSGRHILPLLLFTIYWVGEGFVAVYRWTYKKIESHRLLNHLDSKRKPVIVWGALFIVVLAIVFPKTLKPQRYERLPEKWAGVWIRNLRGKGTTVFTSAHRVAYYAEGTLEYIDTKKDTIDKIRSSMIEKKALYLVIRGREMMDFPEEALQKDFVELNRFEGKGMEKIIIYKRLH